MNFWFYAFWYLMIGVILDTGCSRNTRPGFWSIVLWPIPTVAALCIIARRLVGGEK